MPRPLETMLGRMEDVNTSPKDGPAARYGYRASIAGSAAAWPLQCACTLWWVPMRRKGRHHQCGLAHGHLFLGPQTRDPHGGHSGVPCGAREGIVNTAQPMAPAVPRAPPAEGWPEGMLEGPWEPRGPWAKLYWRCSPLRCMQTHHSTHAHHSGHAAAEPPMLAR